jgi:hypothetical protein
MADMVPGSSSAQVAGLQKLLKTTFKYNVPTDGAYDEKTQAAVADLQAKLNLGYSSGIADAATLKAMKEAAIPRTKVVVNGVEAWVTKEQYARLKDVAGKRAAESVRVYVSMASEAKMYWEAHDQARRDNWFWSSVVDVAVGTKFPDKGMMDRAVKAAEAMERDARACALTERDIGSRSGPIRDAFAAMDQYREELFGGGEQLVKNLEVIRDGCVLTLQVTSAIATGGASWQIQVGVSAGVAAYEQVLKEADTASKTANYNIGDGVARTFLAGIADGTVGLILKGGNLGGFLDDVAKAACEKAGVGALKQFAIKAANGSAQQMIKDGIKGIAGLMDPNKKFDRDDFIKAAAESMIKGAGLKVLGGVFEKFGKGASKYFSEKDFKGLGDIKFDKAGAEGLKKLLDKKGLEAPKAVIENWDAIKDSADKFEDKVRAWILSDPQVKKAVQECEKTQEKGKK